MSLLPPPAGVPPSAALSTVASGSNNSSSNSNNNNNNLPFEKDKVWYFSTEQLTTSPSRRCGIKSDDELHYRQMTAYLIQEMGQRLQVSQLCINTAIVYMHRFYAFHSFTHFHRNSMASASLFLAAKVEEQPRKLEHVIRAANKCLPQASEQTYADLAQELVFNENVLLQTLGFDVAIDHPHTHVVRTCQLVKACKDLAQTSYFLASNSLHLTSMCLQYRPTVVACFCIYLACKWSRWEIPQSTEGKHWFYYVDKSVSLDLLKQLTDEFISIYEKSPARLKSKLNSIKAIAQGASNRTAANSKDNKPKEEWKMSEMMKGYHSNITAPPELMNGGDSSRDSSSAQGPLLPPPTMVPSQQRRIGPPGNSSSSTSSSSMNHKLPNYPGALPPEAHGDHKSKQPGYRPPSSLSQRGSSNVGGSSASSGNSQRSSSAHPGIRPPMPMDYHKSSRGMQPPVGMQAHGGHKTSTSSKPQQPPPPLLDGRSSSSSSASNLASAAGVPSKDVNKAISNSKMYPTPPSFSSSGTPIQLMSRGGYQSIGSGGSGNGTPLPPSSGYSSHGTSHRSSKSSSGVSSASSSVHSLPSYDQPPPQNFSSVPGYNQHMQQQQQMPPPEATQPQLSKNNSLFSPEWSDIKKEPQFNGLLPPPPPGPGHDSLGFKLNSHTRDRDSPKKGRLTPTKKDKHRTTLPHSSSSNSSSTTSTTSSTILSGNAPKPMLPPPPHKKTHGEMELGNSNLKRANDLSCSQYGHSKLDEHDGSLPRDKVRKLDTGVSLTGYSSYEEKHVPLSMTNGGIETTPDLVRSLLKESLCTTNASLLKPDLKPPIELLEPMPLTPPLQIKKEPVTPTSAMTAPSPIELSAQTKLEVGEGIKELDGVGKSEKKKKKDKHKHKEKDKSKDKPDKEERKKHKKDKQKERSSKDNSMDSLKLVIKTNTATANPNGAAVPLKLKISKNKVEPTGMVAMPTAPAASGFDMAPPTATTTAQPSGAYGGGGAAFSTSNNNSSSSHSTSGKKKHSDRDRDKESKKMQKAQDYAKYNGVGGAYAPLSGAGAATQSLTAPVSNLLGLPANMTTASSTSSNSLATGVSAAGAASGIAPPPAAQPIYNKK